MLFLKHSIKKTPLEKRRKMEQTTLEKIESCLDEFRKDELRKVDERVELLADFAARLRDAGAILPARRGPAAAISGENRGENDRFSPEFSDENGDLSLAKRATGLVGLPAGGGAVTGAAR